MNSNHSSMRTNKTFRSFWTLLNLLGIASLLCFLLLSSRTSHAYFEPIQLGPIPLCGDAVAPLADLFTSSYYVLPTPTTGVHRFLRHNTFSGNLGPPWNFRACQFFDPVFGAVVSGYTHIINVPIGCRVIDSATFACAAACPAGESRLGPTYGCAKNELMGPSEEEDTPVSSTQQGCDVGCPITPATGEKKLSQTDYTGTDGLTFERTFRSTWAIGTSRGLISDPGLGLAWSHNHAVSLIIDTVATPNTARVVFGDGSTNGFTEQSPGSNVWVPFNNANTLTQGAGGLLLTRTDDNSFWQFDATGRLVSVTQVNVQVATYTYSDATTPPSIAPFPGLLITVTDQFTRTLNLIYNASGLLSSVTLPDGTSITYTLDGTSRLTSVAYPDTTSVSYLYEDTNFVNLLTGVMDENNNRFSTYAYDGLGRGLSTELAGGVNRFSVNYSRGASIFEVTDPLNTLRTFGYSAILGKLIVSSASLPSGGAGDAASRAQDANGLIPSEVDFRGIITNYTWDGSRRLLLSTTRAVGLPEEITTSSQWHPNWRLETKKAEPGKFTTSVYNGQPDPFNGGAIASCAPGTALLPDGSPIAVLCRQVEQATTDTNGSQGFSASLQAGVANRENSFTYNKFGQVLTADGPRTNVTDVTTTTYNAENATCTGASVSGCRGQIATISNALSQQTSVTDYNAHGQPLSITGPNGLITLLTYDLRQRLTSKSAGSELTSFEYDDVGQLTKITLPDNSFLQNTYDPAHRLTEITDNLGNKIVYTLDATGNRTEEQVLDTISTLTQNNFRFYNNLNRLAQNVGASGQTTAFTYDLQGNLTQIDGPLAGTVDVTTYTYDSLNRPIKLINPQTGEINYGFNGATQLTSLSDPRSLVTTFAYDGLRNQTQQVSPDTGTTNNTYDAAGNLLTSTDAKAQTSVYTYDALNRVATITYDGGVVHTYQYDQGTNGIGRLTQITEPASDTTFSYDINGRQTNETRTINAVAYATNYGYDTSGRLDSITYPGGRQVNYTLDALGRIQSIATTQGTTQTVVSSVAYRPFGPSTGFTFGNGQTYNRGFDLDGRVSSYTLATQSIVVGYDLASRITTLTDNAIPSVNTYTYDTLDRLLSFTGPSITQGYTFDPVDNRLTKTVGASTDTYTYGASNNRLSQITGTTNRTYGYDADGSTTADSVNTYVYDTRGRLSQATGSGGTSTYVINSIGQRIRKTNTQEDTIYHYDAQGRLIAETSNTGTIQREYIYLGDTPVAVLQ